VGLHLSRLLNRRKLNLTKLYNSTQHPTHSLPLSLSLTLPCSSCLSQVVAFVHFFFISNAMLGLWGHGAYEFYNFLFIIAMFWTIHAKESIEAVQTVSLTSVARLVIIGEI